MQRLMNSFVSHLLSENSAVLYGSRDGQALASALKELAVQQRESDKKIAGAKQKCAVGESHQL